MSTKVDKKGKQSKLSKCIKAPIRVLSRARDVYVQSVSDCYGNVSYAGYGSVMGYPAPYLMTSPRSFSNGSSSVGSDNDLRELIRAVSIGKKTELEVLRQQQTKQSPMSALVPRSQSVAIGRIDEDVPCEFGDEDIKMKTDLYPRSRSYANAVSKGKLVSYY